MSLKIKSSSNESNKHGCSISSIVCHNDLVISGSAEGKIKLSKSADMNLMKNYVWKPTLELVSEFDAPGGILSLAALDNTLYSCSTAETIQSWDLSAGKLIGEISSTLCRPQKLFVDKPSKTLWAGDAQGNVAKYQDGVESGKYELVEEIWDMMVASNPSLIYTARDRDVVVSEIIVGTSSTRVFIQCTLEGASPFCIAGKRLCFFSRDGRNLIVHENDLEKKFPRSGETNASELIVVAMAAASDDVVYTGGYDSTVKKWDLNAMKCTGSVNLNSCINSIACRSENEVFIATSDGAVSQVGA